MANNYYITTAIAYPNARPHMGYALEVVQADFLARYNRLFTDTTVFFQTGTDEHGLKIQRAAEKAGVTPRDFVDEQQANFIGLFTELQISADRCIRTTDADHYAMAQALWKACTKDIEKRTYRAWYNVKQEEFLASADDVSDPSVFDVNPEHVELIEEENYFFLASRYTDQVRALLQSKEYAIWPENRRLEMLNFLEQKGLQDVSISRDTQKFTWGVPVPGDEGQVMYVWFDALTNYLTSAASIGANGEIVPGERWPASLHVIGKDIQRFHALLWPAMLLSAGLPVPKNLLVHGFILADGVTMSKTLGNGVDPLEITAQYGSDALRWYLLNDIPTQDDGDFTRERFAQVYASDLANDYGNLVSRVLAMTQKYCGGVIPAHSDETPVILESVLHNAVSAYHQAIAAMRIERATAAVQSLVVYSNKRIDECKPWELAKAGESAMEELGNLLNELLEIILQASLLLLPVMPSTAEKVLQQVFMISDYSGLCTKVGNVSLLPTGKLGVLDDVLFPRVEV